MKKIDYPKSDNADICLILEGTYPFVRGGVSNWVYELIKVFPLYRFAVIFLGTKEQDYDELAYPLLDNIVHFEAHFLFETEKPDELQGKQIDHGTMQKVERLHDSFAPYITDHSHHTEIPELFDLMQDNGSINETLFTRTKVSWNYIVKQYQKNYPEQSFFNYFWTIRNLHRPFWALMKITNRIPKVRVLHSASTGYAGFLGALLQKKFKVPFILTEHGIYTKERWLELMRNYFFENSAQERKLDADIDLLNIWVEFFTILAKVGYTSADPIISLLEDYRKRQIHDGALPERTRIIPYGIDFNKYKYLGKKGPNKEKPVIAFIGRVAPIKDLKTFIRASALIITKNPKAEAWIAGSEDEDPEYVTSCKNLVEMLGFQNKIKFLGVQDVMELFPKIDVLVLCSISEGSPFIILESFAVGIPVVSTNVGGCSQLVMGADAEDRALGKAGKLVNIADPDGVADAALALLTNEKEWLESQKAGLERVRKYYSMERLIQNYSTIYEEAIAYGRNRV